MVKRKAKDVSDTGVKPVFRCDLLPTHMNLGKQAAVLCMLRDWRDAAGVHTQIQWRLFFTNGRFDAQHDAFMDHGRVSAKARQGVLNCIKAKYYPDFLEKDDNENKPPRRIVSKAPGVVDPLLELKQKIGSAQNQMVRPQVVGILESFISNRMREFTLIVFGSSIADERTRHMLFAVNKARAWFDLKRPVVIASVEDGPRDTVVPMDFRKLARKIMHHLLQVNRKPRMNSIHMVVDQRIAELVESKKATEFPRWLKLNVFGHGTVQIPLTTYNRFDQRQGERKKSFQINTDRQGKITIGVLTDVSKAHRISREFYEAKTDSVSLDFGMSNLLATQFGDLLGRGFFKKLSALDHTIQTLVKRLNRDGIKLRSNKRYCALIVRVRGFIGSEVNRVYNAMVKVHKPSSLVLEKLDFSMPGLSPRMNRLLGSCGRGAVAKKLVSLEQEFGITSALVGSAYTSKTCSCCGYVDTRNRRNRDRFACLWCGMKLHADVNAARNVGSERFDSNYTSATAMHRGRALGMLVSRHRERWPMERVKPLHGRTRRLGAPPDPRSDNPYFKERPVKARLSQVA